MEFMPVALDRYNEYDVDALCCILEKQFKNANISKDMIKGKRIVIKPNLVMNKPPEFAATTHPAVIGATVRILKNMEAGSITIAESSGGPYTEPIIRSHYKACGVLDIAEKEGVSLNYDTSHKLMHFADGVKCKSFNIITPIAECDVIVNMCKLKTHSLTKMSCGVKNLFGTVPGIEKFEMHARFPNQEDFVEMICDLCQMLSTEKEMITVCDGIIGMEGNGPTGGTPKSYGILATSRSPYCLDLLCESLLAFEGTVPLVEVARKRGLCPEKVSELTVLGSSPQECVTDDVVLPDTQKFNILRSLPDLFGGNAAKFFEPKPAINKKTCIGCGVCQRSCPRHTIEIKNKKAKIKYKNCIRCYCCQELCPINSVKIKQNFIIKIIQ